MSLDFGDIHTEVIEGNSRMDLLISTLPTELKIERNKDVSTADIFNSYAQQAADYVARMESYLGFLVVLDAAGNRDEPTPPARQDVDLVDVVTASGARLTVIGLVIRHPRSASDFSS
jgi:hypothetical protein